MNAPPRPTSSLRSISLPERATDDLRFVRNTLSRAAHFTAIPSWSGAVMGAIGLAASYAATHAGSRRSWLAIWLGAALIAAVVGASEIAVRFQSASRAQFARFVLALAPSFVVAALMTVAFARAGVFEWLAPLWLLSYGAGLIACGSVSLRVVSWMGLCFVALGAASLFTPLSFGNTWLGVGFGGLHIVFGTWIARSSRG